MKDSIVLYPALGSGHVNSMVELGKLILTHNPSFSITILILNQPNNNNNKDTHSTITLGCDATAKYISTVSATVPSITFHHIPTISFPASTSLPPHHLTLELCSRSNQHVHHVLQSISKTSNLKAIVLDFFNYSATQVTNTLNIPSYFYYTSGASTLAVLLHYPTILQNTTKSFKDHHMYLQIPGLPTFSTEELPDEAKDPAFYQVYLDMGHVMLESVGIIVNTFDAIEGRAIRALSEGLCVQEGTMPPLFCIGPVISATCGGDESGCLSWLDSQPSQSVVLLSFGSMGRFSRTQLKEIAIGLEKSDQRFLWVVRSESEGVNSEQPSLNELLPEGFLERTKERGMVVRNWAPQAAILSHDSVGGFVTHCGWNSVLEAVCEGVPMVTWPLYAEQKMNRVILVQEMKVALALNESKDGFVSAAELGDRVKELMDSNKGKEIRQRIFNIKISAVEARAHGGSSHSALNRLVQLWKQ
ncbi:UDP-glycosyltransferase 1-like [Gastrolobium bilobum]|uniref:UDP-glycosyltransferase 1-like n=1 Tax=Gastrolobium bilobum TaxID=150636 RepID=UPI002AAFE9D5|nr:UDP-glycosyltransferase 1-like [Gastrolobium bilobum]